VHNDAYHSFSPAIQSQECDRAAQEHESVTAELSDVWTWCNPKQPARLMLFLFSGGALVLEEHVEFEGYGAKPGKHRTTIEVIRIRPKAVDNVVI
jgi:hypothetical protein